jgi:thimet oligopeptidase
MRRLSLLCLFPVVAACGSRGPSASAGSSPPVTTAAPPVDAAAATPPPAFDPVALGNTAEGIRAVCDDHLALAQKHLERLRAMKGAPAEKLTYDATLGLFDDVVFEVQNASAFPSLMAVAHPDKAVRDAAQECQPKADKFMTALYLDADIAAVLKAFAAGEGTKLEGERKKLLADVLRDYRRNGLDLPPEKQERLRALNAEITEIGQKFEVNIASSTGKITVDAKKLEGLPPEYVAKHPPDASGKVTITTDYPDYFPFTTYAKDRKAALDLYVHFVNRGGEDNMKLLDRLLRARAEKAKLLGYANWAAYAIEPRMAKDPKTVRAFLDRVRDAVKEPARVELKELLKEHVALGGHATDRLAPRERLYLEDIVRSKKY